MAEKTSPRFGVRLSTMLLLVALLGVLTWGVRQTTELLRARQELAAARSRAAAAEAELLRARQLSELAVMQAERALRTARSQGAGR
jgi:hypothetical protein